MDKRIIFSCTSCSQLFEVTGTTSSWSRDIKLTMQCPHCKAEVKILWPHGIPYVVQAA